MIILALIIGACIYMAYQRQKATDSIIEMGKKHKK